METNQAMRKIEHCKVFAQVLKDSVKHAIYAQKYNTKDYKRNHMNNKYVYIF